MTWGNLFRHEILSKDPVIGQMAIKYLRVAKINLVKVSALYPRHRAVLTNCYHTQSYLIALFAFYRLDFPPRMIVQVVNSPEWTLIVMKISTASLIVSCY